MIVANTTSATRFYKCSARVSHSSGRDLTLGVEARYRVSLLPPGALKVIGWDEFYGDGTVQLGVGQELEMVCQDGNSDPVRARLALTARR